MFFRKRVWPTETVIDSAAQEIQRACGDDLHSLILHGSHASSTTIDDSSTPISLLVVLRAVSPETLNRLASGYRQITGNQQLNPMVLTVEEIHASTDVFPITFMEMKRCHSLLVGEDVLADLFVEVAHLRLRCEQETKNLLFRMQRDYLLQHDRPERLRETLKRDHAALARTMRGALSLVETNSPDDSDDVLIAIAKAFQLDLDVAKRLNDFAKDRSTTHSDLLCETFLAFIDFVSQIASRIDQLPDNDVTVELISDSGGES